MSQKPYLYLRALRQVDHTVFCVSEGQKTYRDPVFKTRDGRDIYVPYSSGQQVKRSILDLLTEYVSESRAPMTFNWSLSGKEGKQKLEQGEPWSPCDPTFADQLLGGWMRAGKEMVPVKRRSPLSISAMRPIHPLLGGVARESLTFDRSDHPEDHHVRVVDDEGSELDPKDVASFLLANNRSLPMRIWIPQDKVGGRASGLFVYDVAIDLRTLFSVSLNTYELEITPQIREKLESQGWKTSVDGLRLICPKDRREALAEALAHSLIHWRVTSNQSRTYSPQNTLSVAFSDNANRVSAAIRADLDESEATRAHPVLEEIDGVSLFNSLTALGYVPGVRASASALAEAEEQLRERLLAYDYDGTGS